MNSIGRDVRQQHGQNMEFPPIPENAVFKIPAPFHTSSTGEKFSDLFYHCSSVHVVIYCAWTSPGKGRAILLHIVCLQVKGVKLI